MKKINRTTLLFFILSIGLNQLSYTQNFKLKGQFTGANLEKSFINVINTSQYTATISQEDGKFEIYTKVGDSILISSIQYKDVKFIVKPDYKTESLEIPLELKVTELENVDIYSTGLSGDLKKDAEHIKLEEAIPLNMSMTDLAKAYDPEVTAQSEFNLRNIAMEKNQPNLSTNFNFMAIVAGLASVIFPKKGKRSKQDEVLQSQYASSNAIIEDVDFFVSYLGIEEDEIADFMVFAYSSGLNEFLKTNPEELDLIQFLVDLSSNYKH